MHWRDRVLNLPGLLPATKAAYKVNWGARPTNFMRYTIVMTGLATVVFLLN